ncbi:MAG: sensor histidine kinase [Gaiellaceae bacterium]
MAYGALGMLAIAVFMLLGNGLAGGVVYDAVAVSAALAVLLGIHLYRPARALAWLLVALGTALTAAGEITWEVYEALGRSPFPSVADVLYLVGYPVTGAGLVLLARGRGRSNAGAQAAVLDAAIVTVAAGLVAWVFLIEPYAADASLSFMERSLSAAYPLMDVLLLALLVRLLFAPGPPSPAFALLAAGMVCTIAADATFVWLELSGGYSAGSWIDAVWLVGYMCTGAAALHPSMANLGAAARPDEAGLTRLRRAALVAAALTAPAVLAVEASLGGVEHPVGIVVGAAVLPLLALARLAGVVRELERVGAEREKLYASERAARAEAESAQRLLLQQNDRLREHDRLKDEFVALVSHELRTPLTSITGYLELVREDESLGDETRGFLDVVDRNSQRLLRLVSDLLLVAQIESGRLTLEVDEADLRLLAQESVEALRPVAEGGSVELRLDSAPVPPLRGDAARLGQLLDNLVSNAVKFTPPGGRVVVALGASGEDVVLAVSDTGIGVPAAEERRLFDRFFRASPAQERAIEGTGLGLTIARAIVRAHGGSIELTSVEGEGTTARVRLPLAGPREAVSPGARTESLV